MEKYPFSLNSRSKTVIKKSKDVNDKINTYIVA